MHSAPSTKIQHIRAKWISRTGGLRAAWAGCHKNVLLFCSFVHFRFSCSWVTTTFSTWPVIVLTDLRFWTVFFAVRISSELVCEQLSLVREMCSERLTSGLSMMFCTVGNQRSCSWRHVHTHSHSQSCLCMNTVGEREAYRSKWCVYFPVGQISVCVCVCIYNCAQLFLYPSLCAAWLCVRLLHLPSRIMIIVSVGQSKPGQS